jgi:hypothetical protein
MIAVVGLTAKTILAFASGSTFVYFLQPAVNDAIIGLLFTVRWRRRDWSGQACGGLLAMYSDVAARPRIQRLIGHLTRAVAAVRRRRTRSGSEVSTPSRCGYAPPASGRWDCSAPGSAHSTLMTSGSGKLSPTWPASHFSKTKRRQTSRPSRSNTKTALTQSRDHRTGQGGIARGGDVDMAACIAASTAETGRMRASDGRAPRGDSCLFLVGMAVGPRPGYRRWLWVWLGCSGHAQTPHDERGPYGLKANQACRSRPHPAVRGGRVTSWI